MTAEDLIKSAMRKITAYAAGESPSTNELSDGLSALQLMLRGWAGKDLVVFASTKESIVLTPSTTSYTWGIGGVINSIRPHRVTGAYVIDSGGSSQPVDIISEGKYRSISDKTLGGRVNQLFFHPTYPLAVIYLYPVPDTSDTLYLDSIKPFTEVSSFATIGDTVQVPSNYEEALVYNLAIRLASEYGKAVTAEVAAIATDTLNNLIKVNVVNQLESVGISIPGMSGGSRYNINSDSYR